MARRRMIDPGIWQSESFASLSVLGRLVFIGLFSQADDEGRGRAKPVYIKSTLLPYDEDIRVADIDKTLSEIGSKMSVTFYTVAGSQYYSLDKWSAYQRVDKPQQSKIPPPESAENDTPELVENDSGMILESISPKGKEVKKKGKEDIYTPVVAYLNERAGTEYRATSKKTQELIRARLSEGFTEADFRRVIDNKVAEWGKAPAPGQKDMRPYLRPETLFGTKFESYLNQRAAGSQQIERIDVSFMEE